MSARQFPASFADAGKAVGAASSSLLSERQPYDRCIATARLSQSPTCRVSHDIPALSAISLIGHTKCTSVASGSPALGQSFSVTCHKGGLPDVDRTIPWYASCFKLVNPQRMSGSGVTERPLSYGADPLSVSPRLTPSLPSNSDWTPHPQQRINYRQVQGPKQLGDTILVLGSVGRSARLL